MPDTDIPARPARACLLCPPPRPDREWRPADPGYRTCSACLDRLRDNLKDVTRRYLMLNPRPGASNEHGRRGTPGFGSRSPASDHIIAMRDPRSKSCEVIDEWFEPVRLPRLFGADRRTNPHLVDLDRPHREQEHPVRSVPGVLSGWAMMLAEDRDTTPPATLDVPDLIRWLDAQLDYVTRQEWAGDLAEDVRDLLAQLRPATGDPGRKRIGTCPNTVDEGDTTRPCATPLFAPLRGDEIECRACRRVWPRPEWMRLGDLLDEPA